MAEAIPTNMHGVIVEETETGFRADMTHPTAIPGVELPRDALCFTKSYVNPDARTRITQLHSPDIIVRRGDAVTAIVAKDVEETGNVVRNPNLEDWHRPWVAEERIIGVIALRWGLRHEA